jgi:glycosyltransferase involved in cell wall biosynthesis
VQTLHNFRTTCANAMLLRNGKVCETCVTGSAWWGALRRCYRGSWVGSLALAHVIRTHKNRKTWHHKVDKLVALTAFQKSVLVRAGMPAAHVVVKPNFTADPMEAGHKTPPKRQGALFVGRLSPEKGVDVLLKAWEGLDIPLKIVGDGPLRGAVEQATQKNPAIRVLGHLSPAEITEAMQHARVLVLPSIWYEGFPMTLLEAYSCGLPVVAAKIGSLEALVQAEGWHVRPGDATDLRQTIQSITQETARQKAAQARNTYLAHYTAGRNLAMLENIYTEAIQNKAR